MRADRMDQAASRVVLQRPAAKQEKKQTAKLPVGAGHLPEITARDLPKKQGRVDGTHAVHEVRDAKIAESVIDGIKYFYEVVIPEIRAAKDRGERPAVVFDIDNTLFDTRYRTLAAAKQYGEQSKCPALANATIDDIGCDGADTCVNLKLGKKHSDGFAKFWREFFWTPENFGHDQEIKKTVALLRAAKDAGAEIFYLTGRIELLRKGTLKQLEKLPDGDTAHLVHKPKVGVRTDRFKAKQLRNGLGTKPPVTVVAFVSEGRRDISHIQRNTKTRAVWFDFPVDREGYVLRRNTPAVPWE